MLIYKVINRINGKIYIGKTTHTLDARIAGHSSKAKHGSRYFFHNAISKYGIQSFDWSVIDTADDEETLIEKEIYWISYLNTKVPNGYNLTDGGEGLLNPSIELRKKIGENTSQHNRKRIVSDATRKKMRDARLGKPNPSVSITNKRRKGEKRSLETRKRISKSLKGKSHSKESNIQRSKTMKGKNTGPRSEETRKRISEGTKKALRQRQEGGIGTANKRGK